MSQNGTNSVLKAAIWYTVSNFISKSILYLCTPFYTRLLSTWEYGQYNNFVSWQTILTALITLDLSSSISIAYIEYKEDDTFEDFISSIAICSIIIPLCFSILILCLNKMVLKIVALRWEHLFILLICLCFGNTIKIYQEEQRSKIKYRLSSGLTIAASLGSVTLTFILVSLMQDKLTGVLIGSIIFNVVISLGIFVLILKRRPVFKWEYVRYSLIIALPLIPHILSGALLGSSDKVMITQICGSEKTALYSLVYTISMVITMLASSINKAWVPWFYEQLSIGGYGKIRSAVRIIFPVISIFTVGICLIAPEIVLIIGGKKYLDAVLLFPPLILHCVCNFVYTLYVNIEFYNKRTLGISVATVSSALINIVLNYICINFFGYKAAAYTTLFSSVLMLVFHIYEVKRLKMLYVFENIYILSALILTIFICLLLQFTYNFSLLRYILIVIYFVLIAVFIYLKREKIQNIKRIITNR